MTLVPLDTTVAAMYGKRPAKRRNVAGTFTRSAQQPAAAAAPVAPPTPRVRSGKRGLNALNSTLEQSALAASRYWRTGASAAAEPRADAVVGFGAARAPRMACRWARTT